MPWKVTTAPGIVRLDLAQLDEALPQIRDATTVIALLYLRQKL